MPQYPREVTADYAKKYYGIIVKPSVAPPTVVTAPHATGSTTLGSVLNCTMGTWTNEPTSYAYQWLRDGTAIAGAIAAQYTLVAADSTHSISCTVTATNAAGSASSTSNAISATTTRSF